MNLVDGEIVDLYTIPVKTKTKYMKTLFQNDLFPRNKSLKQNFSCFTDK